MRRLRGKHALTLAGMEEGQSADVDVCGRLLSESGFL